MSGSCEHKNFRVDAIVNRLTREEGGPVYAYTCDLKVKCVECDLPFTFPGLANGISSHEARVSINGETMCVPIKPADKTHFEFFPGFDVRHVVAPQ